MNPWIPAVLSRFRIRGLAASQSLDFEITEICQKHLSRLNDANKNYSSVLNKIFCMRLAVHCNFDSHSHDPYDVKVKNMQHASIQQSLVLRSVQRTERLVIKIAIISSSNRVEKNQNLLKAVR